MLVLPRPYLHAELGRLVDRPADPRVVTRIAEMKLLRITGKFQDEGLPPWRAHESMGCLLQFSVRLQFELQRGIHAHAFDEGRDQSVSSLRIGCERTS